MLCLKDNKVRRLCEDNCCYENHGSCDDYNGGPLCGERLLASYLRESNIDSAKHAWAVLAWLVKALRKRWPEVKITVRADSGFCRWKMLRWCERAGVNYIVGSRAREATRPVRGIECRAGVRRAVTLDLTNARALRFAL